MLLLYDIKPYFDKGVFSKLKHVNIFNSVRVAYGTVSGGDDIDLCADSLYESSTKIKDYYDNKKQKTN